MPARNMASLMRDDPDHVIGCLASRQQTGVDEDALAASDERIYLRIPNQIDLDKARVEAGSSKDGCDPDPNVALNFGIAYEAAIFQTAILCMGRRRHEERAYHHGRDEMPSEAEEMGQ